MRTSEDILRGYHISLGGHVSLLVPNLSRQVAGMRSPTRGIQGPSETLPRRQRRAIVHPQELLARPAAVLLVAGLARGAHERIGATVEVARRTAAPPLWVVGHGTRTELGIRKRRTAYGHGPRRPPGGPRLALDALNRMTIPAQYFSNQSLVNRPA